MKTSTYLKFCGVVAMSAGAFCVVFGLYKLVEIGKFLVDRLH